MKLYRYYFKPNSDGTNIYIEEIKQTEINIDEICGNTVVLSEVAKSIKIINYVHEFISIVYLPKKMNEKQKDKFMKYCLKNRERM
jgi:hypothetical protein